jgi:integrase
MMKAAVREGLIVRNPAEGVDLPRIAHREAAFLEPGEVERIAEAMSEPYGLMVRLMGRLGPRYGEAAALRRRSVDMLRRRLVIEESVAEVGGRLILGSTKTMRSAGSRLPPPSRMRSKSAWRTALIPSLMGSCFGLHKADLSDTRTSASECGSRQSGRLTCRGWASTCSDTPLRPR